MANQEKNFSQLSEVEEEMLRNKIREFMLQNPEVNEYDALFSKEKNWKDETQELRADLTTLLKNIENDDYEDGIKTIERVSNKLRTWKKKIQNYLA